MKKTILILSLMLVALFSNSQNLANFDMIALVDQQISCRGNNDGFITVECYPASVSYDYYLKLGKDTIHNTNGQFHNLRNGTYKVWVVNPMGVTKTATLKMDFVRKLTIDFMPQFYPKKTPLNDSSGVLSINITGGTALLQPYLATWTDKNGTILNDLLTNNYATTIENLPAGKYTVVVEDDRGCFATKSYLLKRK